MYTILLPFYWYIQERNNIKDIINTDVNQAKTELDVIVAEHNQYVADNQINLLQDQDPEVIDNLSLNHAKEHLDAFVTVPTQEPEQKQAAIDALDEEVV